MKESNCFRGVSGGESGKKTKKVNIFDKTPRQIRCTEKIHDYLGDSLGVDYYFRVPHVAVHHQ